VVRKQTVLSKAVGGRKPDCVLLQFLTMFPFINKSGLRRLQDASIDYGRINE